MKWGSLLMARKGSVICLLLAVCLVGCRITVMFIDEVLQPLNVCLDFVFEAADLPLP